MPPYTMTPTNVRIVSSPMSVIPRCRRRIKTSQWGPLLNRITDPIPERSVTSIKIKPNSHRFADQILLRNEAGSLRIVLPAAVFAVVAVVAHEEVVPGRNHPLAGRDAPPGKHDLVALGPQLLERR